MDTDLYWDDPLKKSAESTESERVLPTYDWTFYTCCFSGKFIVFIEKRSLWLITLPVFILILEVWRLFVFLLSFQKRAHKLIDREGKGFTSQNTFLIKILNPSPNTPLPTPSKKKDKFWLQTCSEPWAPTKNRKMTST